MDEEGVMLPETSSQITLERVIRWAFGSYSFIIFRVRSSAPFHRTQKFSKCYIYSLVVMTTKKITANSESKGL